MQSFSNVAKEFSSPEALRAFADYFICHKINVFPYAMVDHNIQALYEIPQRSAYLLLQGFCRMANCPDLLSRCTIEYINEREAQAYAASSQGFHHIAVAYSLPILLQAVFQYLLSKTNPFSADDPAEIPAYQFPESLPEVQDVEGQRREIENLLLNTMPEARWQKIMSTKLAEIAVLFCFAHEIAHLVRGHSALAEHRGLIGVTELTRDKSSGRRKKPLSHRLSQAWELQADRTSLAFLFSYVNNNKFYKRRLIKALKCGGTDESLRLITRVTYAISFVFFIFGQGQISVASTCSHPSALTRQTFAMSELASIFLHMYPEYDEDTVVISIQNAASKAEIAWNRLGFSFGNYNHDIAQLPLIVQRLFRYDTLAQRFLSHYQWATVR